MATRSPATGDAQVVCMSMQLELTDDVELDTESLRMSWLHG